MGVHEISELRIYGVIDLNLPLLLEEDYPLQKTLYHLPRKEAEDGRGLLRANISKWQPKQTQQ